MYIKSIVVSLHCKQKQIDMKAYTTEMNEIASLAKRNGLTAENLTSENLKEIMKQWLENVRVFQEKFSEAPLAVKKQLLNI